jgi:hypothetical protein
MAGGGAGVEDLRDAWMLEAAEYFHFVLETATHVGIQPPVLDDFERDDARRMLLLGAVDDAHSAFADGFEDAIASIEKGGTVASLSADLIERGPELRSIIMWRPRIGRAGQCTLGL